MDFIKNNYLGKNNSKECKKGFEIIPNNSTCKKFETKMIRKQKIFNNQTT